MSWYGTASCQSYIFLLTYLHLLINLLLKYNGMRVPASDYLERRLSSEEWLMLVMSVEITIQGL